MSDPQGVHRNPEGLTFLTPYWSGREMMRTHLASIRAFHPFDPILISKKGGDDGEMAGYARDFGVRFWLEECSYMDAFLRLLERCETRYVCILDHDTILFSSLDSYVAGLQANEYDLVGIEECIRLPSSVPHEAWAGSRGWLRFAPDCVASNFILFDWKAFKARWGLKGILGQRVPGALHFDFDYGIGQKLTRHKYLRPYHAPKYGLGNLLRDGDAPVVWHQWYGSYATRLANEPDDASEAMKAESRAAYRAAEAAEQAFLADYPNLDWTGLSAAWGPDMDVAVEREAALRQWSAAPLPPGLLHRALKARRHGILDTARRVGSRLERWWRLR